MGAVKDIYDYKNGKILKNGVETTLEEPNWEEICAKAILTEPFIEKFKNEVNWTCVSVSQKLSEPFIEKFRSKINWWVKMRIGEDVYDYISNKITKNGMWVSGKEVDWEDINSGNSILSEQFIERFQDKLDWGTVSRYQKLSEPLIERVKDKVDWEYISIFQKLSEPFIEKFAANVHWGFINRYQDLSVTFKEKFKDKLV